MTASASRSQASDEQCRQFLEDVCRQDLPPAQKLKLFREACKLNPANAEQLDTALLCMVLDQRAALHDSAEQVEKLKHHIEELLGPPHFPARCLALTQTQRGMEAYVSLGGQVRLVPVDEEIEQEFSAGDEVLLNSTLNQVLARSTAPQIFGETALLERELTGGNLLVSVRGDYRTVIPTRPLLDEHALHKDDLIQLDPSGVFAIGVVPATTGDEYLVKGNLEELPSFDDIGGLVSEKQQVKDLILLHQHADVLEQYGVPRENAILLAGKPGSGKTMFAQATCRHVGGRFVYIGASDLQDRYYGETQRRIKLVFAGADAAAERDPSKPIFMYFEEVDAYLSRRTSNEFNRVHNETTASLLSEIDGFHKHNTWLMASTNRLADLDPASVRGSRFGTNIITFTSLRRDGARQIFQKHLQDKKLHAWYPFEDGDPAGTVESLLAMLYSPNGDNHIADLQFSDGSKRTVRASDGPLTGSEISKICRHGKERAMLRYLKRGEKGIRLEDLLSGVDRFYEDTAAKLRPHNVRDYFDLPDDLQVTKVEPARRLKMANLRVA